MTHNVRNGSLCHDIKGDNEGTNQPVRSEPLWPLTKSLDIVETIDYWRRPRADCAS